MTEAFVMKARDRPLPITTATRCTMIISKTRALTYRQNVVLLLPKHLRDDNMAVKPIARELRVTRVKNSLSGAWERKERKAIKIVKTVEAHA